MRVPKECKLPTLVMDWKLHVATVMIDQRSTPYRAWWFDLQPFNAGIHRRGSGGEPPSA